ncbi:DUF7116 family protein [Halomontanus rarus]|uniref:DUF7116 family protein n=1 Tax=Halomontanus rarus TaxID=3034020 RepID=UPI001A99478A|nr:hypothetical protein [Halovivax sp. TS33]
MRLVEQARSIFAELGYTVEGTGPEFRAEREWKVVHVSTVLETGDLPSESGEFRCFVATREDADDLEQRLRYTDPDYEWAIIVVDGDDYEVERAPPGPKVSAQA